MRVDRPLIAAILVVITPLHVQAQQNSREQARIYNQQSGPRDRLEDRWQSYSKYDYNRPEKGQPRYYANRYYRDSRYYKTRSLTRIDRIYRGSDHLYYCRRPDGTTGRVAGIVGHSYGDVLALGGSNTLGAIADRSGSALMNDVVGGKITCS